jgi:hypothetical protein
MARVSYVGLGPPEAAVRTFDALLPYVLVIRALQAKCLPMGPDESALEIAVDGLEAAAFHFTHGAALFRRDEDPAELWPEPQRGLGVTLTRLWRRSRS